MKNRTLILASAMLLFGAVGAQTLDDAKRLTDNEQYEKAKAAFRQLIVAEPTNGDIYFFYGDLMIKADDIDSAGVLFKNGVDINPTNPLTHVGLARYYMYTGKNEDGMKSTAQAKALVQTQAGKKGTDLPAARQSMIYLEMAETFTFAPTPNPDEAIALTQVAEKLDPKNPEVFLVRGDALYAKDPVNATPAIAEYKKAANLDPKSNKASLRIGQVYKAGKNMPDAIVNFKKAIEVAPNFAPAWREQGEAFYLIQKFDSASLCYEKYLALNDDPWARYRYTAFLYKSGNYDDAIKQGTLALSKDSAITVVYRIVAKSYMEKKQKDAGMAITFMNLFFKKQKQYGKPAVMADDYLTRGRANYEMKNDSLAVLDYQEGLKLDPSKVDLYFEIGGVYFRMKNYMESATWYKKKIDASDKPTISDYNAYGRALFSGKDYVNADSAFKKVTEIDPNNPIGWFWRGRANSMLDPKSEKAQARPYYEKYLDIALTDKEKNKREIVIAAKYLAGIHYIAKNFACSKGYFLLAAELAPDDKTVKEQLDTDKDIKAATAADINTCKLPQ
jgi:tetratricopeptide (TPR) repeat protein